MSLQLLSSGCWPRSQGQWPLLRTSAQFLVHLWLCGVQGQPCCRRDIELTMQEDGGHQDLIPAVCRSYGEPRCAPSPKPGEVARGQLASLSGTEALVSESCVSSLALPYPPCLPQPAPHWPRCSRKQVSPQGQRPSSCLDGFLLCLVPPSGPSAASAAGFGVCPPDPALAQLHPHPQ